MHIVNEFEVELLDSTFQDKKWAHCYCETFSVHILVEESDDAKVMARKFLETNEIASVSRCSKLLQGIVNTLVSSQEDLLFIETDDMSEEESQILRNELEKIFSPESEIFSYIIFGEDNARVSIYPGFLSYFNTVETELVLVYKDTINHTYNGDDNLCILEVKKSFAQEYYKEKLADDYESFEEWLENGTCDLLLDFYDKAKTANAILDISDY